MRITIIGAGNGGQAMAGHFSMLGHLVTIFDRDQGILNVLSELGAITLNGAINGVGKIFNIANCFEDAVRGAEIIMVTTSADAHNDVAQSISPYVEEGQIVILNPGRTFGAIEFDKILKETVSCNYYLAEAQTLIYACRAESVGRVRIIGIKQKVLFSAFPSTHTDFILEKVNSIYNCFVKVENCLVTGLENIGAVLHPSVVLFNAATIERGDIFYFYNDMTDSVANFIEKLDNERLEIGKACNIKLRSVKEWISYAYRDINGNTLCEKMRNNPAYFQIKSPDRLNSRLLLEDVPTGILPMIEIAKIANVETPLMESILKIVQSLLNIDFYTKGRTLKNLGIEGISISGLKELVK